MIGTIIGTIIKIFLVSCVIAIILDPLFFYIPIMDDENKCIEMDKILGNNAAFFRSVFDLLKILNSFYL